MNDRVLRRRAGAVAAVVLLAAGSVLAHASVAHALTDPNPTNLTIEGDSWPEYTVQQLQTDAYNAHDLGTLNPSFTAVTSGEAAARSDLATGQTDIAAVSEPLTSDELATAQQNGITPGYVAYGLSGVSIIVAISTQPTVPPITSLNLTVPTIAKIYAHQIDSWSDPAILAENPTQVDSLTHLLVPSPITTVERRTSSSTTAALISAFLADPQAAPIWNTYAQELGAPTNTVLDVWPDDTDDTTDGVTGGEEDVVSDVLDLQAGQGAGIQNGIGYVAPGWAQANNAITAAIAPGGSTNYEQPDQSAIQAAFDSPGVAFNSTSDLYMIDYSNLTNAGAYPIPLPAYFAVPVKGGYPAKAAPTASFLTFALSSAGQNDVGTTGMAPVPADVVAADQAVIASLGSTPTMKASVTAVPPASVAKATSSQVASSTPAQSSSDASSGIGSSSSSSDDLPDTGGALPVGAAAVGIGMVIVGDVVRRRARRARFPQAAP